MNFTRRAALLSAGALAVAARASAQAQAPAPVFQDAAATDPAKLGWMQGTPPPADKRIAFEDGSYFQFPKTRWSFSNYRNFVRSIAISRGAGPVAPLPLALRADLDGVQFTPLNATAPMSWRQSLDATYADAIIVLHRGRIAYERYFGVTTPESQHILFSVTKSFVGTIAHSLIAEGKLDPRRTVATYVPELAGSGFGDAEVQHVLDMTSALKFDENYTSPTSTVVAYSAAGRLSPRAANYQGPEGLLAFAATVPKDGTHGERFVYRTVNTDMLAWIIARIEGKPFDQVLSARLWSRLGMEADASLAIDGVGTPVAGGGLLARLRDVARFGEAMRRGGAALGRQVIPAAAISAIASGGTSAKFAASAWPTLAGWSYTGQWWISHSPSGAYMARGIHGQAIYIDPKAEMVIARFASHPVASNVANDPVSLPAYRAVADALNKRRA